jgi:fructose-specific phosphotransferase system IIC component
MRKIYLALAFVGLLLPWALAYPFLRVYGFVPGLIVGAVFANPLASAFAADLLLSIVVFWVWSWFESRRLGLRGWGWYVLATLVGLSFSLPLFLYTRSIIAHSHSLDEPR